MCGASTSTRFQASITGGVLPRFGDSVVALDVEAAHFGALAGAAGAVLVLVPRRRELLLAGIALVALAEASLVYSLTGRFSPALLAAGVAGGFALVAVGFLFVRYPALVTPLVLAAAPFRLPLDFDRGNRFFVRVAEAGQLGRLLPLYAVLGAATAALALRLLRNESVPALPPVLAVPAAAFFAYVCLSLLWSNDRQAGETLLAYFLLPFAILVAVVARAPFPAWMPRALAAISIALASLFALVGLIEAATEELLFFAPNLEVANTYTEFFRVTSLFRDPSLYGRHLVLGLAVVMVALWLRRLRLLTGGALVAFLFTGLYFSYSQSSFAALFVVVLAIGAVAGERRVRVLVGVTAAVLALVGAGVVAASVADESARSATSDRSRRAELTADVFRAHPVAGVGIGAQPKASQARADRFGPEPNFVSHTTPLTVAAELGVIGFAIYLTLLAGAVALLIMVARHHRPLGLTLGAVLLALFVHSLFYSGFFEDPITWLVLAIGASFLAARNVAADFAAILGRGRNGRGRRDEAHAGAGP